MRARTALLAAAAIAIASTTPAVAAVKKPVKLCNLLTDAPGDGEWNGQKSAAIDILSADIATGKTEMVAVLRVGNTNTSSDTLSHLGYIWRMGATGNGTRYSFEVRRGILPPYADTTSVTVGTTSVPHTFKILDKNTFQWTFKRSAVPLMSRPKIVWGDFGANSNVMSNSADGAASERKYPDRALSCITAK